MLTSLALDKYSHAGIAYSACTMWGYKRGNPPVCFEFFFCDLKPKIWVLTNPNVLFSVKTMTVVTTSHFSPASAYFCCGSGDLLILWMSPYHPRHDSVRHSVPVGSYYSNLYIMFIQFQNCVCVFFLTFCVCLPPVCSFVWFHCAHVPTLCVH